VLSRFASITDASIYINEILRDVMLKVYQTAGIDPEPLRNCCHTRKLFEQLRKLESEGVLKVPVFILIDDFHLLRFGRALSSAQDKKEDRKILETKKVSFILFTTTAAPSSTTEASAEHMSRWFPNAEQFDIPATSIDSMLDITKADCSKACRRLGSDHLGLLRNCVGSISEMLLH